MLDPAGEQPAGLHHLVARVVDRRRRVIDRADQRHLVHHRRQPGEDLRDLDARHLGRDRPERPADLLGGIGLHVPGVELRRPADQEQQDAIDVAILRDRPRGRQRLHRRQPQPQRRQRPGVEEIPAGQAVAEMDRLLGVDSEHGATSRKAGCWTRKGTEQARFPNAFPSTGQTGAASYLACSWTQAEISFKRAPLTSILPI